MHVRVPAAVLFALTAAACGGTETPDTPASQETAGAPAPTAVDAPLPFQLSERQEEGKTVYETMCWSCHGFAGRGDGPAVVAGTVARPRDLTAVAITGTTVRQLQAGHNRKVFIYNIVTKGTIEKVVLKRHETKGAIQDLLLEARSAA